MVVLIIIAALYLFTYAVYIARLTWAFSGIKPFAFTDKMSHRTTFSIVVVFRNEADNLAELLQSFASLDYPRDQFELIFINDDSTDDSERLVNRWRLENGAFATTLLDNLRLSASPKKDAIARAISIANGDFIVTTDADCSVNTHWLSVLDAHIQQTNAKMIAAPVFIAPEKKPLTRFQQLDFLSLQATTLGSFSVGEPFMCNAANFAYRPDFFKQLGGFRGNEDFAGGDDVFLLQKAVDQNPNAVTYLLHPAATVYTKAVHSVSALISQRVRWASKAKAYKAGLGEELSVVVLAANLVLVCSVIGWAMGFLSAVTLLILALLKFLPDVVLLVKASRKFGQKPRGIFLSLLFYPVLVTAVALFAAPGKFSWKGRRFTR